MARVAFSCDYSIEEIKNLGFIECVTILEANSIDIKTLEDLEEIRDLIIKNIKSNKEFQIDDEGEPNENTADDNITTSSSYSSSADLMSQIISRDKAIKAELNQVYNDLKELFKMRQYTSDGPLKHELQSVYPGVETMLKEYSEELISDECPIVVTGETSAGKSTLLNLLLGNKILPSSLRSNTSTVCRLRNKSQKMIKVHDKSGENVIHSRTFDDNITDETLRQELHAYISCKTDLYKFVDIYWPMPFLGSQVIIVDTPGVGEDSDMTNRLMEYLPKAVAFIYVINSENAGGVQQDRLLRIIETQKQWSEKGGKQTFDHNCTLFVCNKWDEVPEHERRRVWSNTEDKLRSCWPGFKPTQMFKLSALEVERRYTNGLDYTEDFKKLLRGIDNMVPATLQEKVKQHAWWQERLLKKIMHHVTARLNNTRLSQEEKKAKKEKVEAQLQRLECNTEDVKKKLKNEAKERCETISKKLYAHMHSPDIVRKLKQWDARADIPLRESDISLIEHEAKEKILIKIGKEIKQWCETENPSDIKSELTKQFRKEYSLLEEQCRDIDSVVQNTSERSLSVEVEEEEEGSHRIPLFAGKEKLALVLTAPLWVPLMVLALSLASPVMGVIAIKDNLKEKQMCKRYIQDKESFMNKWADEVLSKITLETISTKLQMTYLENFHACLDQLCDVMIPRLIQSDRELVENIQNEERRSSVIRRQYQPLEKRCQMITGKHLLVQMEYFYEDKIINKNVEKGDYLGRGSFANVYKAEVVIGGERKPAAVKCMTEPLDTPNSYSQLTEVTTLLTLNHGWIVKMFGISYEEVGSYKHLQIIMELCDFSLSSQIFPRSGPAPVVPCSRFKLSSEEGKKSLEFFKGVSMDVCRGLVYIHKQNFIHRDLKPSNVLLKNGTAKIADVGLTKERELVTGTLAGTPCYAAPEVIKMKLYGTEVDIYSLGIMLWEMWYGTEAYKNDGITGYEIWDHVKNGHRPGFNESNVPYPSLQKLMKQCWQEDGKCRPEAGQVFDVLKDTL
ncbi:uncharacterized protein [Argopecten irradians]|uniref:uncharacterized protein n=1 Tax=Argopecten irradians TaxID=31199 RepID=UPI003722B26F